MHRYGPLSAPVAHKIELLRVTFTLLQCRHTVNTGPPGSQKIKAQNQQKVEDNRTIA